MAESTRTRIRWSAVATLAIAAIAAGGVIAAGLFVEVSMDAAAMDRPFRAALVEAPDILPTLCGRDVRAEVDDLHLEAFEAVKPMMADEGHGEAKIRVKSEGRSCHGMVRFQFRHELGLRSAGSQTRQSFEFHDMQVVTGR